MYYNNGKIQDVNFNDLRRYIVQSTIQVMAMYVSYGDLFADSHMVRGYYVCTR